MTRPSRSRRPARHAQRGVAAVELAFLMVPLLLMLLGTVELGRAMYTYDALDKSVRDAARHLSRNTPGDPVARAEAACLAVFGNTGCSGSPITPALGTQNVVICDALSCPSTHRAQSTGEGAVNLVTVTIHAYEHDVAVRYAVQDLVFDDISVTMRGPL